MNQRLTVASYNIHKCVGRDGRHLPERTFEVLRELDADVIGIQEFHDRPRRSNGPVEVADFESALGYRALAQRTVASGRGHQANLLLTRLPILDSETIELKFGFYEPRGVLVGDLESAGGPLRVAVTHLGLWPTVRRRQAARLAAQLQAPGGAPLVLLGDFNEWLPLLGCHGILEARFGPGSRGATWPAADRLRPYLGRPGPLPDRDPGPRQRPGPGRLRPPAGARGGRLELGADRLAAVHRAIMCC